MRTQLPDFRWTEIVALLSIIGSGIAVVVWGLKLDTRTEEQGRRAARVETIVDQGILPRTDERLRAIERRLDTDEKEIDRLQRELDARR
jgi:hypothetical protein